VAYHVGGSSATDELSLTARGTPASLLGPVPGLSPTDRRCFAGAGIDAAEKQVATRVHVLQVFPTLEPIATTRHQHRIDSWKARGVDLGERLARLMDGATIHEVSEGHQSRVFVASRSAADRPVIVKVLDASLVDGGELETRVAAVAELSELNSSVCRPLPIDGRLVSKLDVDGYYIGLVTCYEYAVGATLLAERSNDATLMGNSLALLHVSMRRLQPRRLPLVAALRTVRFDTDGSMQLLHGDFNASNLRRTDGVLRIFDFDDCGYGPPQFDIANALYMVLFDDMTGDSTSNYHTFTEAFLSGYSEASGRPIERDEVHRFIDLRIAALESWLDNPVTAPTGIRTATAKWHTALRSFIETYRSRSH
jgi:Ser/Thr protein kinase RdoA (MazF antagonist)